MTDKYRLAILLISILYFTLVIGLGCGSNSQSNDNPNSSGTNNSTQQFRIISGSENKTLEPIIQQFAKENNIDIKVDYRGSVDIMMQLQTGKLEYDAVWPANSLWIDLGDMNKLVKDSKSILWSPVALGVKKSVANSLGWIGKKEIKVEEITKAAESGKLRFMMTSATQSNSGASAYIGFLYAFAGKPDILSSSDLAKPIVRSNIKRILGSVNRSSGSSGFLKDLFLEKYDNYDAMFNYEAVLIETNQELDRQGKEPLYIVYPSDGLAIADSPLGYVDSGDASKSVIFKKLQDYLLSSPIQQKIVGQGRRVGTIGDELKSADVAIFNPDWGIRTTQFLNIIHYPKAEVIQEALDLYQTSFRKPSFTVYVLDYSGSMRGERESRLKTAMKMILNQQEAKRSLLQASPDDVTVVVTFSDRILDDWTVVGNSAPELNKLIGEIDTRAPDGGTAIFTAVMQGFDHFKQKGGLAKYFPAMILMTDGESNTGASFEDFKNHIQQLSLGCDIPVYAILFGEASTDQLDQITKQTSGKVFDGKQDLTRAFRESKGYN